MNGLLAFLLLPMPGDALPTGAAGAAQCVVLLHGLARSPRSMRTMQLELEQAGYTVANVGYPSRQHPIEDLAPLAVDAGLADCHEQGTQGPVHFVTHSLGGILLRYYAAERQIPDIGRVVMLGPPNQGSAAADKWRGVPGFRWLNGPAGFQLGKGADSLPRRLPPPTFEFAVIAGDRSIDPITSSMLQDPDDGRVSVADTKLEGMRDFRIVHATHAFMTSNDKVIELVINFLANGRFAAVSARK